MLIVITPLGYTMTKFHVTPFLENRLEGLPHGSTIKSRGWITTNDLLYLSRHHNYPIDKLTRGLKPYSPPKKTTPSYTPEFQAQLDRLRNNLEEQEYQQMINRGKLKVDEEYITPSDYAKEVKNQITTIVNILVSVLSVVYAIWYWTDNYQFNQAYRVLLCLFFGILVLVAEVVVFNAYIRKMDEAKTKEQKKKEVKKIVDTVIINPKK